jgi:hypothetical protein
MDAEREARRAARAARQAEFTARLLEDMRVAGFAPPYPVLALSRSHRISSAGEPILSSSAECKASSAGVAWGHS